jgi:hypothetical protein
MNLVVAIYSALLFVVLTPGVFLRLPSGGSKTVVAGVHALLFALVLYYTAGFVWRWSIGVGFEGFKEGKTGKKLSKAEQEYADMMYRKHNPNSRENQEKGKKKKKH